MSTKPKKKAPAKKKTSVAKIVAMHAAYQGRSVGRRLREIFQQRGMTQIDFIHLLGRGNDPTVYGVLRHDDMGIGVKVAQRWEAALGVPEGTFPARGREIPTGWRAANGKAATMKPASNGKAPPMLAAPKLVAQPKPMPLPREPEPDQFAFVIDATGKATLRLNLEGVPLEAALRTVQTLTTAGMLRIAAEKPRGETKPLKEIGHATRSQKDTSHQREARAGAAADAVGGVGVGDGGEQRAGVGEEG